VTLLRSIGDLGGVVGDMLSTAFADELAERGILVRLADRLERNLVAVSGGNPADPRGFSRAPKLPPQFDAKAPEHLVSAYLDGTPLLPLFDQTLAFTIPTKSRYEHQHIVAGSGHGKTQTLQYLIANDLPAVADGNRTVIVLDSQGDLIRTIASLHLFAPGEPLHERVVIIDPSDVEWPVSLNLFDVGMDRLLTICSPWPCPGKFASNQSRMGQDGDFCKALSSAAFSRLLHEFRPAGSDIRSWRISSSAYGNRFGNA